jgi:hypothetical protein
MTDTALWTSFRNVHFAAAEIEAMWAELDLLLENLGDDFDVQGGGISDSLSVSGDWLCHYYCYTYRIRARLGSSRLRHLGTVTFAISFWREEDEKGMGWEGGKRSKFYVAFCPSRSKDEYWDSTYLFVDGQGTPGDPEASALPPFLWAYRKEDGHPWHERNWFFCVILESLQSAEDIQRHAISPLVNLLRGASHQDAFENASCQRSG